MIFPSIHMNGTGRDDLMTGYMAAWRAVADAGKALRAIEFNARDYYVIGPDAFEKARAERKTMFDRLDAIQGELGEIYAHIQDSK